MPKDGLLCGKRLSFATQNDAFQAELYWFVIAHLYCISLKCFIYRCLYLHMINGIIPAKDILIFEIPHSERLNENLYVI